MSPSSMKDKVIAITGGAQGMGLALARLLAQQGAVLSIADNQQEKLEEAGRALAMNGAKVMTTAVDVRDTEQVDKWIDDTIKAFGRLDGAANLAGVLRNSGRVSDIKDDEFDFVMDINVKGVMKCMRAELRAMEKTGGGSIVNASSIAALRGSVTYSAYVASKHAVLGLTRVAAKEHTNVRVNAICPGLLNTGMLENEEKAIGRPITDPKLNPMKRFGEAEEAAKLILFLLGEDASYINGAAMTIDGGMTA